MPDQERSPVPDDTGFRSGFVALVGRPSAGKSTLLNACVSEKVAPVSPVSQTTRRRLRAVVNLPAAQLVIVDTPGLHKPSDALGSELNKTALAALADVDVAAMLVDATAPVGSGDAWVARHVAMSQATFKLLVITKADAADAARVSAQLEAASRLAPFDDALVISALAGFNVDAFLRLVGEHMPPGPRWFPEDLSCDATDEQLVEEFVREKVLLNCRDEVPHAVAVRCEAIRWNGDGRAVIRASILVERESQKAIVIGRGGAMIRRIGSEARRDLEHLFGDARLYLDLVVRVQPRWRHDRGEVARLGLAAEDY